MSKFWQSTVHCAGCSKIAPVPQLGAQPPSWVVIVYTEKRLDPNQPLNPPQEIYIPYPFCGPACAALHTVSRAWDVLSAYPTSGEKERFVEALRSIPWLKEVVGELQ